MSGPPHANSTTAPREGSLLKELASLLRPESVCRAQEPMAKHTTMRIGGPAELYVEPASEQELQATLRWCSENSMPFFILGRGSNLLVKDGGIRGVVICLANPAFAEIKVSGERLICGAGARLKAVATAARDAELTGLEFLEGIPGSLGGALRMNAGAMGSAIFERIQSVRLVTGAGEVFDRVPQELRPTYRSCPAIIGNIVVGACLQGTRGPDRAQIRSTMDSYSSKRWSSQPAAPSAGCVFKNPLEIPAGKLVDELGLKGTRLGGAMVSHEHGNFIVNEGSATAVDVLQLIALVKERAKAERGISLETEVEIVGE